MAVLVSSGCSDSNNGDPAASQDACHAYCDAYLGAMCPDYATVGECKDIECGDIPVQPAICQTKIKTYYDCQKAQADLCGFDECHDEFQDLLTCE
jgi:hypothetical protein